MITEAGNHPEVAALVYIAAFAPDKGESVNTPIADPPPGAPVPPILPPQDGFHSSTAGKFRAWFAGGLNPEQAAFMVELGPVRALNALGRAVSAVPARRSEPS